MMECPLCGGPEPEELSEEAEALARIYTTHLGELYDRLGAGGELSEFDRAVLRSMVAYHLAGLRAQIGAADDGLN